MQHQHGNEEVNHSLAGGCVHGDDHTCVLVYDVAVELEDLVDRFRVVAALREHLATHIDD